ncbi:MAG: hypothetical protein K0R10_2955 [Alphaproteobacteria bacterium]|nr:hypothetical protein [Alphaproteobacteria bacterium]
MIRISPAPPLPYTPGAPLKYRRADIAPAEDMDDVESKSDMDRYEDGELPSSVPLPSGNRRLDTWV